MYLLKPLPVIRSDVFILDGIHVKIFELKITAILSKTRFYKQVGADALLSFERISRNAPSFFQIIVTTRKWTSQLNHFLQNPTTSKLLITSPSDAIEFGRTNFILIPGLCDHSNIGYVLNSLQFQGKIAVILSANWNAEKVCFPGHFKRKSSKNSEHFDSIRMTGLTTFSFRLDDNVFTAIQRYVFH